MLLALELLADAAHLELAAGKSRFALGMFFFSRLKQIQG
jgi:hypothetical protein